jgi:sugar-specific transcriptional regulator TrmB
VSALYEDSYEIRILKALATTQQGLTILEVAHEADISINTAYSRLARLEAQGKVFIMLEGRKKLYRLKPAETETQGAKGDWDKL